MRTVLDFFFVNHDFRFVVLAAVVCILAAFCGISLLVRARKASGRPRLIWLTIAAVAVGFGIWSTHFIGMLAFHAGFPLGYDPLVTAASLAIAILACGLGFFIATFGNGRSDHVLAGIIVGLGIAGMHYTGMSAMVMGGEIAWNNGLAVASVLFGSGFAAWALVMGAADGRLRVRLRAAALLTLAICSTHFIAMGAADLSNCFAALDAGNISPQQIALDVGLFSILILAGVLAGLYLDARDEARQRADAERILAISTRLELALTHMSQGLALFDANERLILANSRLNAVFDIPEQLSIEGLSLRDLCAFIVGLHDAQPAPERIEEFYRQHKRLIAGEANGELVQQIGTGRAIRIVHRKALEGGWVSTVEDITERQRSEAQIAHLARHDGLTELPNRQHFNDAAEMALDAAIGRGQRFAVLGIDLDRFKEVNDHYGHAVGDSLLKSLAERMSERLEDGEFLARFGGDEFAAFKPFADEAALHGFIERIESTVRTRFRIGENDVSVGASIGVAIYPQDGDTLEKLSSNADLAMYRAKANIAETVCFYEAQMDEMARERRLLARDLWSAIERDQFELHYQVQKSVSTGKITGYEVLLRWNHPTRGRVSPADFIPIAEECGAILPIGEWVLRQACKTAATWDAPYKIAVNLSPVQLAHVDLVPVVAETLLETGLSPHRLELEVTESAIIGDKVRALHILRQIKDLGVTIAIDDFGTGYSSLETLRSFPFDKIKLDRSFMQEVETSRQSKAIIRAILALGRSLEVPVLAEGVETASQLDLLSSEGCDEAQGYYLGWPQSWAAHKSAGDDAGQAQTAVA